MHRFIMTPGTGERLLRHVGDNIRFSLRASEASHGYSDWKAFLRTDLGRGDAARAEIIKAHTAQLPLAGASWRDIPLRRTLTGEWQIEFPLSEIGFFKAKAYATDPQGRQYWPEGPDAGISIHPDTSRTANIIYCAFTRLYGPTRTRSKIGDEAVETRCRGFDQQGYTVIPPSGTLRDLAQAVPHIVETLGCRVLHLLPINPTPTTFARMGRYGSPYAAVDFTAIDPALVEFDRRTTAVDQFGELADAVHLRGARLFLDLAINHTGWGSTFLNEHPEWFVRRPDGTFVSPGAWGNTWEDLVELSHNSPDLWDALSEAFLVWCRRGVDGFRCDAGYKVPLPAWQYIVTRVRLEFPQTIFLLEGLGGAWEATESLLGDGGMQWAYSELFQNYAGKDVAWYLDYSLRQSTRMGLWVHYSETHDNPRLAALGRGWSLLRNRLCALTSVSGAFGYTGGVEWLATEKVNVHQCAGLNWGGQGSIVPELAQLSRLLSDHPCFFDGAALTRVSPPDAPVYILRRDSSEGRDHLLVLANTDHLLPHAASVPAAALQELQTPTYDLLSGRNIAWQMGAHGAAEISLKPAECLCLARQAQPAGLAGEAYRQTRAQAAFGVTALARILPVRQMGPCPWSELAELLVKAGPSRFLSALSCLRPTEPGSSLIPGLESALATLPFPTVVTWSPDDRRRVTPVPPGHWLLVEDATPFRATLVIEGDPTPRHLASTLIGRGHFTAFPPRSEGADARLAVTRYDAAVQRIEGAIRYLDVQPQMPSADEPVPLRGAMTAGLTPPGPNDPAWDLSGVALLTNGRGGMARLRIDLGRIQSKYDCLLGANLHPEYPVDRHVFAKRARVWVNADGFLSPLDGFNLAGFCPGPPATWRFIANAGDGRCVEIQLQAAMIEGANTTVLFFQRARGTPTQGRELSDDCPVSLTVRVDIEDRNFHWETQRNGGADFHFSSNTQTLNDRQGFRFRPAPDRVLHVYSTAGSYHPQPEWCENIPHPIEQSRGQTGAGDAFSPGWFEVPLPKGGAAFVVVTAEAELPRDRDLASTAAAWLATAISRASHEEPSERFGSQLARSVRAYVVRRTPGKTVVAGYPWFLDWGRDSLICARGLLAAGLPEEIRDLLSIFGRWADKGTLPNSIHGDNAANRDTSDAPLWFCLAAQETARYLGTDIYSLVVGPGKRTLAEVIREIVLGFLEGTPNGIRVDAASGLVWSPSHFTWMDTNFPAGTPREGYPVEIQALWIHTVQLVASLQEQGFCEPPPISRSRVWEAWKELAARARDSFVRYFWLEQEGYLADVLLGGPACPAAQAAPDSALRSNCLMAITLDLLEGERARRCVDAARRYLVVPGALRTLAPLRVKVPLLIRGSQGQRLNDPAEPYWGRYEGDEDTRRKPSYHNGTAWTWTFPIFCEALAKAWDYSPPAVAAARAYLGSMSRLLMEGCAGHPPEIVDGDAPHTQRGCDAQAWGATEALRVWTVLNR